MTTRGAPPPLEEPYPGCGDFVKLAFTRKDIPGDTIDIMTASLSKNTLKQYNSTFSKWWGFCRGEIETILQPNAQKILAFLKTEFDKGAQYSTLNTHRSALNLICDGGNSEIVVRFMKGIFKLRPQFPKYQETWDPQPVLAYLSSLYPLDKLNLELSTIRMVLLLALCSAQRAQTFSKIRLSNIKISEVGIEIRFSEILKTSGPNKPQPVLRFHFFKENPEHCICSTLMHYIEKTKVFRGNEDFLILTIKKPHKPATSQTISRWIKKGLRNAGIDPKFKGHSTRHSSSSAALRAGTSIESIRKAAGWSEKSETFNRFYNKPLSTEELYFADYIKKYI
ncbi:unnamed protein product [Callosobruchus maculatus]|uniref:Tyr recombinase domain-containing protein n=1 Tax=Callosobruchus maculatus TaxID=64391 RepID=A0A653DR94_CALMS|nr:unnamed protein product [Callosobruchus maculatus]